MKKCKMNYIFIILIPLVCIPVFAGACNGSLGYWGQSKSIAVESANIQELQAQYDQLKIKTKVYEKLMTNTKASVQEINYEMQQLSSVNQDIEVLRPRLQQAIRGMYTQEELNRLQDQNRQIKKQYPLITPLAVDSVIMEGKTIRFDVTPVIYNERTLLPVRAVCEALGAEVTWDQKKNTATVKYKNRTIRLVVDEKKSSVSGREVKMDTPAILVENRVLIPLRFIAENMWYDVRWDNDAQVVEICDPKNYMAQIAPEDLEKEFSANDFMGQVKNKKSYRIIKGTIPVLISAPHGVQQYRDGSIKASEAYTGAMALMLQQRTGAWVIVKNKYDGVDDNYIEETVYKDAMQKIVEENDIRMVLDIHGMNDGYDADIELGTNDGNNYQDEKQIEKYKKILKGYGLKTVLINENFRASSVKTVSHYASRSLNVNSIQIEMSRAYRNPMTAPEHYQKACDALVDIVYKSLTYY